ncbi:MAG: S-methyl-5-thioribose-1-phosphate isomerase [Firmicutes bacterium]|nr:S-methyl-5-thioribose-1-phosphate isomerase [Bacillota bacterium]
MKVFDIAPVKFTGGKMLILDQTKLPGEEVYIEAITKEDVWDAIYHLKVRGAPAIGVAAGYGLYISVRDYQAETAAEFAAYVKETAEYLNSSRPTAVNLSWALKRMVKVMEEYLAGCEDAVAMGEELPEERKIHWVKEVLRMEAEKIHQEDEDACFAMGEYGLSLLKPGMGILTHCNAGTIATAKYGTCLAPIHLGQERGYNFKVFADETRPLLQGARLTAWELNKNGVDVTLICDNMASIVMKKGLIDAVVVGCDRMAANGDGANKIGTSGVAILAKEYGIPFYMYVPTSTIDLATPTGEEIEIEERKGEEIYKMWYEKPMAPEGIKTFNPAFDVTDNKYITAVITEKGIVYPPYDINLRKIKENE